MTKLNQRTYIRRRGRMTKGQRRALAELGDRYVADPEQGDWPVAFGRTAPLGVEIGFGMGHALLDWAMRRPDMNLVGIEIYQPGIGALLAGIERQNLSNLRVLPGNAVLVLEEKFRPASIDEIRIWFPDPWPRKRHHKRRLIQPAFAASLASRLAPGGWLRLATDWAPYAEWIATALNELPALRPIALANQASARPASEQASVRIDQAASRLANKETDASASRLIAESEPLRPETRFESRGRRLGHEIHEFAYRKEPRANPPFDRVPAKG